MCPQQGLGCALMQSFHCTADITNCWSVERFQHALHAYCRYRRALEVCKQRVFLVIPVLEADRDQDARKYAAGAPADMTALTGNSPP